MYDVCCTIYDVQCLMYNVCEVWVSTRIMHAVYIVFCRCYLEVDEVGAAGNDGDGGGSGSQLPLEEPEIDLLDGPDAACDESEEQDPMDPDASSDGSVSIGACHD